jgi:hypothetical protein
VFCNRRPVRRGVFEWPWEKLQAGTSTGHCWPDILALVRNKAWWYDLPPRTVVFNVGLVSCEIPFWNNLHLIGFVFRVRFMSGNIKINSCDKEESRSSYSLRYLYLKDEQTLPATLVVSLTASNSYSIVSMSCHWNMFNRPLRSNERLQNITLVGLSHKGMRATFLFLGWERFHSLH